MTRSLTQQSHMFFDPSNLNCIIISPKFFTKLGIIFSEISVSDRNHFTQKLREEACSVGVCVPCLSSRFRRKPNAGLYCVSTRPMRVMLGVSRGFDVLCVEEERVSHVGLSPLNSYADIIWALRNNI